MNSVSHERISFQALSSCGNPFLHVCSSTSEFRCEDQKIGKIDLSIAIQIESGIKLAVAGCPAKAGSKCHEIAEIHFAIIIEIGHAAHKRNARRRQARADRTGQKFIRIHVVDLHADGSRIAESPLIQNI